jgi:hypothetical protein
MSFKRLLSIAVVLSALAVAIPVSGLAADDAGTADDWTIYLRPAVRFGSDDRVLFIVDALVPVYRGADDIVFINGKFTPDNREAWETNFGVGYRKMVVADKLVLGGNFFYDHRKTRYGSHFNQLGLGFEAMAELNGIGLTTRFNYYQPITGANRGAGFAYAFYGNGIYSAGMEEPLTGFDYEAGVRIPWVSNYVETWAYAGGYHFFGRYVPDVNGVSARIEAMPTDFLKVNFEYRNDNINHDEYYGEVAFEVPFSIENLVTGKNPFEGIGDVLTGSRTLKERMVEPVRRDVDIVVGKETLSPAEASEGDLVAGIIFVSDSNPSAGDGTYENPYNDLALAAADPRLGVSANIVHVLAGDGSGVGGGYFDDPNITIWGAGAEYAAYPNLVNFVQGYPVVLSTLTMDAPNPTVLGLQFNLGYGSAYGIELGANASDAGLSIYLNIINNAGNYAICYDAPGGLGTAGSPAIIRDNVIDGIGNAGGCAGIYLESDNGSIYARILNNTIDDVWAAYYAAGIYVGAEGNLTADILGNNITDIESDNSGSRAYGMDLHAFGDIAGAISGNYIGDIASRYDSAGISAWAEGDFTAPISGNTIIDVNAYDNFEVYAAGIYTGADGSYTGSIYDNVIHDVDAEYAYVLTAFGIWVDGYGGFTGNIYNNTVTDIDAVDAYEVFAGGIGINPYAWLDGDYTGAVRGSIYGNTVDDVRADYCEEAYAVGILGYVGDNDYLGDIYNNAVTRIETTDGDDESEAYGILAAATDGDMTGNIFGNEVGGVRAWGDSYEIDEGHAYGICAWADYDYRGSIFDNSVTDVGVENTDYYAEAFGIYGWADGTFLGDICRNTVSDIAIYDSDEDAFAHGIMGGAAGDFAGDIFRNTITDVLVEDSEYAIAVGISVNGIEDWWEWNDAGSVSGSVYSNTISGIHAYDAEEAYALGILGYAGDNDYAGSIVANSINDVTAEYAEYANARGISLDVGGDFTGSVYGNTIGEIVAEDAWEVRAYGIWGYVEGDFLGSIYSNALGGIVAEDAYYAIVYGIRARSGGDFTGSICNNRISGSSAFYANDAYATGIGIYADYDFTGSVYENTISGLEAYFTNNAYVYGIEANADNAFLGSIYTNSLGGLGAHDASYTDLYGISASGWYALAGMIHNNKMTGLDSGDRATGINLSVYMGAVTTSVMTNYMTITATDVYGLFIDASYPGGATIGTVSTPLLFVNNGGALNGTTAYAAYLDANNPGASSVSIGNGGLGMGNNKFTTTGTWNGTYPVAGGPIWANDNSFIHP